MSQFAYVSYMANDRDLKGVLCLAYNLRKVGSAYPYIVITIEKVSDQCRQILRQHQIASVDFNLATVLQEHGSDEALTEAIIARHYYGKLLIYQLTQYTRIIYLDTDLLLMDNVDALFELPLANAQLYMARDMQMFTDDNNIPHLVMTTNGFNSGVIVTSPCQSVAAELFRCLLTGGLPRFQKLLGDQDIFNQLANQQVLQVEPLHPKWNLSPWLVEDFLTNQFMDKPKIIHFMLRPKPWELLDGTCESAPFSHSSVTRHLYWLWISIFQEMVQHRYFSGDAGPTRYANSYYFGQFTPDGQVQITSEAITKADLPEG